jgi:hypothetical protein
VRAAAVAGTAFHRGAAGWLRAKGYHGPQASGRVEMLLQFLLDVLCPRFAGPRVFMTLTPSFV